MFAKKYGYYYSYGIIVVAILVSAYLLNNHFSIIAGKTPEFDLCSAIFGKGCMVAALSKFSMFLKIPVGGWGIMYMIILLTFIAISHVFIFGEADEIIQIAFWISFAGVLVSIFFTILMIAIPPLFCPYCTIFHVLNFILFFLIKKLTGKTFSQLLKDFIKAFGIFFLGKTMPVEFNKWKWLAFIFPILLGLTFYQWILMQEQNIRIEKLSDFNPLEEIENFESSEIFDVQSLPDEPILGLTDAKVTLVVFSDFQCSVCNMFASNFKYLIDYNKGKLNIRFKYFPLNSKCNPLLKDNLHPMACESAWAGEAARLQGRFWEYHDSLFVRGLIKNEQELFEIARLMKMDIAKFNLDYNSEICRNKINEDIMEGIRLNIDGTPTAFLNGRKLINLSESNINYLIKFLVK